MNFVVRWNANRIKTQSAAGLVGCFHLSEQVSFFREGWILTREQEHWPHTHPKADLHCLTSPHIFKIYLTVIL